MASPPQPSGPLQPDEDRGPIITTALWTFTATATVLQIARLWSRLRLRKLGWGDYWMFFTTALLAAFAVAVQITADHGGGRHLYHLASEGPDRVFFVAKLSWISQPFCIMALGTGKVSVGLLILGFLPKSQKVHRYSLWFCMVTVNLGLAGAVLLTFLQCNPPQKLWKPYLEGSCWPPTVQTNYSLFAGSYSAAADIYLAWVPFTILWGLQMQMKKKIGLCIVFGLGILAGACGFYKTSKIPGIASHGDITWDAYDALLFTGSEIWLVIICGTIPTIKPVWDVFSGFISRRIMGKPAAGTNYASKLNSYGSRDGSVASKPGNQTRVTVKEDTWYRGAGEHVPRGNAIHMQHTVEVHSSRGRGDV